MKYYNSHGKYKPEVNEYFHVCWCQLNFAMFYATRALGISWQHLNQPNLLVHSFYGFHVYFHLWIILHHLGIFLPHEDSFSKFKNSYIESVHYSVCNGYDAEANKIWMYGDWFHIWAYAVFGGIKKSTRRSPSGNLTQWIISESKGFKTRYWKDKYIQQDRVY